MSPNRLPSKQLLAKAQEAYRSATSEVEDLVKASGDRALAAELVKLRLAYASATHEIAKSFGPQDAERTAALQRAAAEFMKVHENYERQLAGLYAQAFAADCYFDLGETKKSLEIYAALLELPAEQPTFAHLRKRILWRAMSCWLNQTPPDYDQAIGNATTWLEEPLERSDNDTDALAVHYYLAEAYVLRANAEKGRAKQQEAFQLAAANAQYVAKHSKERGDAARDLLKSIPAKLVEQASSGERPPVEVIPSVRAK